MATEGKCFLRDCAKSDVALAVHGLIYRETRRESVTRDDTECWRRGFLILIYGGPASASCKGKRATSINHRAFRELMDHPYVAALEEAQLVGFAFFVIMIRS